jgi:hypothetical protein
VELALRKSNKSFAAEKIWSIVVEHEAMMQTI